MLSDNLLLLLLQLLYALENFLFLFVEACFLLDALSQDRNEGMQVVHAVHQALEQTDFFVIGELRDKLTRPESSKSADDLLHHEAGGTERFLRVRVLYAHFLGCLFKSVQKDKSDKFSPK